MCNNHPPAYIYQNYSKFIDYNSMNIIIYSIVPHDHIQPLLSVCILPPKTRLLLMLTQQYALQDYPIMEVSCVCACSLAPD